MPTKDAREDNLLASANLDRSIPTREALVHSIPIYEVKNMTSDVLQALKALLLKKSFEPCLQAQF
jgi:hypothetical protein